MNGRQRPVAIYGTILTSSCNHIPFIRAGRGRVVPIVTDCFFSEKPCTVAFNLSFLSAITRSTWYRRQTYPIDFFSYYGFGGASIGCVLSRHLCFASPAYIFRGFVGGYFDSWLAHNANLLASLFFGELVRKNLNINVNQPCVSILFFLSSSQRIKKDWQERALAWPSLMAMKCLPSFVHTRVQYAHPGGRIFFLPNGVFLAVHLFVSFCLTLVFLVSFICPFCFFPFLIVQVFQHTRAHTQFAH